VIPRYFYDIVLRPGCADRSLRERGLPTVLYAHDMYGAVIGSCNSFVERDERFVAEASLFVAEDRRVQLAYETWVAMTARNGDGRAPLREFSIGFDLVDARWETVAGEPINEADPPDDEVLAVYDLELFEFSPVLVGAAAGTGFLRGLERDELLERFPRPAAPALAPARLSAKTRSLARQRFI
jgi:hypothetical protein